MFLYCVHVLSFREWPKTRPTTICTMSAISIYSTIFQSLLRTLFNDLVNSKCIAIGMSLCFPLPFCLIPFSEDEMDVSVLNLGMIAAYYNISCECPSPGSQPMAYPLVRCDGWGVHLVSQWAYESLKGLLEVVSSSAKLETIPIRRHQDALLRRNYDRVPVKLERADFETPHFKTFLLLHTHFSRSQLLPDLAADQVLVLGKVLNLWSASVVWCHLALGYALGATDLSQMCVQAM